MLDIIYGQGAPPIGSPPLHKCYLIHNGHHVNEFLHIDIHGSKKSKTWFLYIIVVLKKIEKNQIVWPEKLPILLWFFSWKLHFLKN
jgi:hypothetical protein